MRRNHPLPLGPTCPASGVGRSGRPNCHLLAALLLLGSTPAATAAQASTCGDRCLEVEAVLRVSSNVAAFAPSTTQSVLVDDRGFVFISHRFRPPAIVVYDSTGAFVSLYDRQGDGPGELRSSGQLWPAPGGSILAGDTYDSHRLTRFDTSMRLLETLRTEVPVSEGLVALDSGRLAVAHSQETVEGRFRIALLDSEGRLERPVAEDVGPGGGSC